MAIAAIETTYAGCRFRSRLEARWAVFLDRLDIQWEYEPQGYEFDGQRYLPDFHLPAMGIDVEVKGVMDETSAGKLTRFAHHGKTILVLGDVPRPGTSGPHHWLIDQWRGAVVLEAVSWLPASKSSWFVFPLGRAMEIDGKTDGEVAALIGHPPSAAWIRVPDKINAAYADARSARFEHGQAPVTQPRTSPPAGVFAGEPGQQLGAHKHPAAPLTLVRGDRVMHAKYGQGTVKVVDGAGLQAIVTVEFEVAGQVRLMMLPGVPLRRAS